MPDLRWNRATWSKDLRLWRRDHAGEPYGDQWGDPDAVPELAAVRDRWVLPFVASHKTVLEIGPGGGRWTRFLLEARLVWCVDIHEEMFAVLRQRFGRRPNLRCYRTAGTELDGIEAGSVDFVFSFGTLVHLDPALVEGYLRSLRRVVRPAADLVLQYSEKRKELARDNPGFAATTAPLLEEMLARNGYAVVAHDCTLLAHSNIVHARPAAATPASGPSAAGAAAAPP